MLTTIFAWSLSFAHARSKGHLNDRPMVALCTAHLLAGQVNRPIEPAAISGRIFALGSRTFDKFADQTVHEPTGHIGIKILGQRLFKKFHAISRHAQRMRLLLLTKDLEDPSTVSISQVLTGREEIDPFLDGVQRLTSELDPRFAAVAPPKFGLRETARKAGLLLGALGATGAAFHGALIGPLVFGGAVAPVVITAVAVVIRRLHFYLGRRAGNPPPLDAHRVHFGHAVHLMRDSMIEAPDVDPRTVHFGHTEMITRAYADALRAARSPAELSDLALAALTDARHRKLRGQINDAEFLSVDYIYTSATATTPAELITVARLRRSLRPVGLGGRKGKPRPKVRSSFDKAWLPAAG